MPQPTLLKCLKTGVYMVSKKYLSNREAVTLGTAKNIWQDQIPYRLKKPGFNSGRLKKKSVEILVTCSKF